MKLADWAPSEETTLFGLAAKIVEVIKESGVAEPVLFNLGAGVGQNPDGFRRVDYYSDADVQADLFAPSWDFTPDESVDCFFSSHFVEHIPDWEQFFLNVHKKLKVGGFFLATTPYYSSRRAFQDPDHKQFISEDRYWYLNRKWRQQCGVDHYEADVNFDYVRYWLVYNEDFAHLGEAQKEFAAKHYVNAVDDITVLLRKAE